MQNDSQYFKMAGIYLLGLIQDVLLPQDFSENDLANIWNTMLQNIDELNLDLTRIIAKSLSRLASASQISFQVPQAREMIMSGIFNLFKIDDQDILKNTLEALIEISRLNYELMGPYLE